MAVYTWVAGKEARKQNSKIGLPADINKYIHLIALIFGGIIKKQDIPLYKLKCYGKHYSAPHL
jgi:hypothetical protein